MSDLGIELELAFLFGLLLVGSQVFAPFEVETPAWKKIVKWSTVAGITLGLYLVVGHWALLPPLALAVIGLVGHAWWCEKHGIHPLRATPRRKYYELRGWDWLE